MIKGFARQPHDVRGVGMIRSAWAWLGGDLVPGLNSKYKYESGNESLRHGQDCRYAGKSGAGTLVFQIICWSYCLDAFLMQQIATPHNKFQYFRNSYMDSATSHDLWNLLTLSAKKLFSYALKSLQHCVLRECKIMNLSSRLVVFDVHVILFITLVK